MSAGLELNRPSKYISYSDETCDGKEIHATVFIEESLDPAYGTYVWPSSIVMGDYLFKYRNDFIGKRILEVGAGTSLPSILLAKISQPVQTLTTDLPSILSTVEKAFTLNKITSSTQLIAPLKWGAFDSKFGIAACCDFIKEKWGYPFDYIIGSDTFYEPSQFENLIVTVAYIINTQNVRCKFLTTYHERSPKRSIQHLLDKWELKCRLIETKDFKYYKKKNNHSCDLDMETRLNAGTLSSIFMLEISTAKKDQETA